MSFFVGYFPSLTRSNSNLMWHNVFVTAPLFGHIDFNAWFRSFGGTLVFFCWFSDVVWTWIFFAATLLLVWYSFIHRICLPSASSIQSNSSQVLPQIGIPINTSQLAGIVWRGLVACADVVDTTGRISPTHPLAHSSQNVSSDSTNNLSDVHS